MGKMTPLPITPFFHCYPKNKPFLAFFVNVIGPEFLCDENARAFLRIEAAARQYSAHSGESIYLIRRPLSLADDHFVLLWSRGAALVGLYPYGGTIRGELDHSWRGNRTMGEAGSMEVSFDNPNKSLSAAVKELEVLLDQFSAEGEFEKETGNGFGGDGITETKGARPGDSQNHISAIAIFTGQVREISFREPIRNTAFSAMTADQAVTRSAVHIPNILRMADRGKQIYSNNELTELSDILQRSAQTNEKLLKNDKAESLKGKGLAEIPSVLQSNPSYFILHRSNLWKWLVPLIVAAIAILFFTTRSTIEPSHVLKADTLTKTISSAPRQGEIVIELPVEAELFVSTGAYKMRSDLDRALALGLGQRYLPDTIQYVVMDSLTLAKGAYGYFKVNNAWRRGKLLETFQPFDTIRIVKFLDPLLY